MPQTIEGAFAKGAQDMIVVLPDSKTVHNGSMYSSSVTTGDFEQFIARDVVAYIDAHYRTIAKRSEPRTGRAFDGRLWRQPHRDEASRRLRQPVHHEPMLPFGRAGRIGQPGERQGAGGGQDAGRFRDTAIRPARPTRFRRRLVPDPKNPPLYLDLPTKDGVARQDVLARGRPTRLWHSSISTSAT